MPVLLALVYVALWLHSKLSWWVPPQPAKDAPSPQKTVE